MLRISDRPVEREMELLITFFPCSPMLLNLPALLFISVQMSTISIHFCLFLCILLLFIHTLTFSHLYVCGWKCSLRFSQGFLYSSLNSNELLLFWFPLQCNPYFKKLIICFISFTKQRWKLSFLPIITTVNSQLSSHLIPSFDVSNSLMPVGIEQHVVTIACVSTNFIATRLQNAF